MEVDLLSFEWLFCVLLVLVHLFDEGDITFGWVWFNLHERVISNIIHGYCNVHINLKKERREKRKRIEKSEENREKNKREKGELLVLE